MKTILLYNDIWSFTAEAFIETMNENADVDKMVRVNCPGGSVFAGWGMCATMNQYKENTYVQVDGSAASMGLYFLLYAKKENVTALNVSRFLIHSAYGNAETQEDRDLLSAINEDLRALMHERFDDATFLEVVKVSIDSIFDDERKDVWINAEQARDIGLIGSISRLSVEEQTAMSKMVASSNFEVESRAEDVKEDKPKFTEWDFKVLSNNIKI